MAKVYCCACKNYRPDGSCKKGKGNKEDTWLERVALELYPWEKNANNDCPDYKGKKEK